jgi:hypothetical protein
MGLRTAFYDWHVAHGGRMVDFAGWDMPVQYTTIVEEHQAVRTGAGLFDISHMGRLSFGGAGSLDLIEHVYTNNATPMKDFQVRYGLIATTGAAFATFVFLVMALKLRHGGERQQSRGYCGLAARLDGRPRRAIGRSDDGHRHDRGRDQTAAAREHRNGSRRSATISQRRRPYQASRASSVAPATGERRRIMLKKSEQLWDELIKRAKSCAWRPRRFALKRRCRCTVMN